MKKKDTYQLPDKSTDNQVITKNSSLFVANQNEMLSNQIVIPKIGDFSDCVSVIEKEENISHFIKYIKLIDNQFGVSNNCSTNELMQSAINCENRDLIVLSGYAHLLLAELMTAQSYDVDDINKEINKAEALLDFANLGGNHPLLPRTMKLKRRVNWKSFLGLGISCAVLLILLLVIGFIYRFIIDNDINIF